MRYIFALLFAVSLALGQQLDLKSQSRNADFSTHAFIKPWVIGTSLPATCSVGDAFFDSDATAGQNVYVCTATNTWTLSSGAISGLTSSRALQSDGSGNVAVSSVTSTELGYLSGVTSAVQTQLNAKQATITGAATTITGGDLTASRAVIANASGKIAVSAVTDTELGYVSGVTSALQTQLNAKLSSTPPGSSGQFIYNNAGVFGAKAIADGDLPSTLADKTLTGPLITASLVANLPSAASNPAKLYVVIDGTAVGDCTTGGGSAVTLCRSNSSAWVAFGDGNSGGGGLSPPASNGMLYGTTGGTTTGRTITASTGITVAHGDGATGNPTVAADTAVMLTRAQAQSGADLLCVPASASGANYTCAMTPALSAYTTGMVVQFKPDVSSTGAATLNIDALGAKAIKKPDGAPVGSGDLAAGKLYPLWYDGTEFRMVEAGSGGGGGSGTVTSVGLSVPSEFSVSGSPITSSGTLAISKVNQSANAIYAGPTSGGAAAPAFRALVAADLPSKYDLWTRGKIDYVENFDISAEITGRIIQHVTGASTISYAGNNDGMIGTVAMLGKSGGGIAGVATAPIFQRYTDDSSIYPLRGKAVFQFPAAITGVRVTFMGFTVGGFTYTRQLVPAIEFDTAKSDTAFVFAYYGSTTDTRDTTVSTGVVPVANTVYTVEMEISAAGAVTWSITPDGGSTTSATETGPFVWHSTNPHSFAVNVAAPGAADRTLYLDMIGINNQ